MHRYALVSFVAIALVASGVLVGLAAGTPTAVTLSPLSITETSATLRGTVQPNGVQTNVWIEYGVSSSLGFQLNLPSVGSQHTIYDVSGFLTGLQPNTTYYYRLVAENSFGTSRGTIVSFVTTLGGSGGTVVNTQSATEVNNFSARLNGTVSAGQNVTVTYRFEYGVTQSLGSRTADSMVVPGSTSVPVSAVISGLQQNTTYYFRIVGESPQGTSQGVTSSFFTSTSGGSGAAPIAETREVFTPSETGATLRADVNPRGVDTTVWFEYGTNPSSLSNSTAQLPIGTSNFTMPTSAPVFNLLRGTTYYYRVIARSNAGTTYGNIMTFVTAGTGTGGPYYPPYTPPSSGLEPIVTTGHVLILPGSIALNARVDPRGSTGTAWIEYGTSQSLGTRSASRQVSGSGSQNISSPITVTPGVTYYFRGAAQTTYGTSYGNILTFTLSSNQILPPSSGPPATPGTPTTGEPTTPPEGEPSPAESCVSLILILGELRPGEEFTYTAEYRNDCGDEVRNVVLRISLPDGTEFVSSGANPSSQDGPTTSYDLGTVSAGSGSSLSIRGELHDEYSGESALFRSELRFTDSEGRTQVAAAFINGIVTSGETAVEPSSPRPTANILAAFGDFLGRWWVWLLGAVLVLAFLLHWFIFKRREREF